ncbi:MAG: C4-type zinc ribbon domain-containing protein [Desulfobacterales bacterium]|nr:C4-type zinc ribbon domain-containing protein [Desulfobacterales bacterium]
MKEQIQLLVKLQEIENRSTRMKKIIHAAPERKRLLDANVEEFEQQIVAVESLLNDLKIKYRAHESDLQLNVSTIKKSEGKLRSIKDNTGYQAVLKEIDFIKTKNSEMEDLMLEDLEHMEKAESVIQAKKEEFMALSNQMDGEKAIIEEEKQACETTLVQLEKEWDRIRSSIEPGLLEKFIKVKNKTGAIAIAPTKNSVCLGCNLNMPPQMYNDLHRPNDLMFCPHCERIIYLQET